MTEIFQITGHADAIVGAIDGSAMPFYVYMLLRPDGQPFYVGKGINRRILQHEAAARNTSLRTHKLNVIRAILRSQKRVSYALADFFEHEAEAHACERRLILQIGRHDLGTGPLTNQTDGGEGASNPSVESRARRAATLGGSADDPERRIANEFFHQIAGQQDSVPIKPLGARPLEATTPHPSSRQPTQRMAVVLVAAALANETQLAPGLSLPRLLAIDGRPYVIENGVAKDMLKAGMIRIESGAVRPQDERFVVTQFGFDAVLSLLTRERLIDLGVFDPL
ncbi:MAG TPA: GIY-YIG nuclease family protein [Bryobacteraceae bacterium]